MRKICLSVGCAYRTHDFSMSQCPRCGKELVVQLEQRDRLEDYVIQATMAAGKGGMATVYRARHVAGTRDVALKIAHGKPFQFDALYREADCLAQLDHPNIVKIIPLGQSRRQKDPYVHKVHLMGEPLSYLVMGWIEGNTLAGLLNHSRPPLEDAVRIADRLAQALEHAHQKRVLHLDIKPANVMIEALSGEPVLMDFGIARRLDKPSKRISEKNLGTAGYMAPEHIKALELDERADVFSLGVLLYELVTGVVGGPFKRDKTEDTLTATCEAAPKPVSQINPSLSRRWDAFFAKALAKRPEDRYQNMREFRQALAKLARPPKVGRYLLAAAVAAMLVAIAVLGVLIAVGVVQLDFWRVML